MAIKGSNTYTHIYIYYIAGLSSDCGCSVYSRKNIFPDRKNNSRPSYTIYILKIIGFTAVNIQEHRELVSTALNSLYSNSTCMVVQYQVQNNIIRLYSFKSKILHIIIHYIGRDLNLAHQTEFFL